jgi:galactokinase
VHDGLTRGGTAGFEAAFGAPPTAEVRAPGRVNLIGEHIDYHGLPVLPMALTRTIRVAFRPRGDRRIRVVNDRPAYRPVEFELDPDLESVEAGSWENYVRAAARAVVPLGALRGVDARVESDVPPAAGLSSSSALVVAVARALLAASEVEVPAPRLADALAQGERFVGTEGGGMDQAVSLGARSGTALKVDFAPLAWRAIPLPRAWRIVVAHSGVAAEKSGSAREAYNRRRRESECARESVADHLAGHLAGGMTGYRDLIARFGMDSLVGLGERVLEPGPFRRFRHVVLEAGRVDAAVRSLEAGDLETMGACLVASHASLRDDYEVSHPALDRLVETALAAGAAGARLTGAGFGGCMLALTDTARVQAVVDALQGTLAGGAARVAAPLVFVAEAGGGARVLRLDR